MRRIWLIGGSEGIGAALAQRLAGEGAALALSARDEEALAKVAAGLPLSSDAPHLIAPLDARDLDSVSAAFERILAQWGGLDAMIYCAGAYTPMGAAEFHLGLIEKMVDTNLSGALRALSLVLPYFRAREDGHIVLFGSIAGYSGLPRALGYGLSKAALIHLAENLKADLRATNIKVQLVCPGFVKTRLTDKNDFPMPLMITADDAARHVAAGLRTTAFEIHFPKAMTLSFKLLRALPYAAYFWIVARFLTPAK